MLNCDTDIQNNFLSFVCWPATYSFHFSFCFSGLLVEELLLLGTSCSFPWECHPAAQHNIFLGYMVTSLNEPLIQFLKWPQRILVPVRGSVVEQNEWLVACGNQGKSWHINKWLTRASARTFNIKSPKGNQ